MAKINLTDLTFEQLENEIISLKEPSYRAEQIFISVHKKNNRSVNEITSVPVSLRDKLNEKFIIPGLVNSKITDSANSVTRKFLFETDSPDPGQRNFIESVLISEKGRETVCISTQSGCNVGCGFCATGKMGFKKNLSVSEIVSQIYEVKRLSGKEPTNIVYMGMGEPFLNYENMLNSLKILTHPSGFALSSNRITVSTVGFTGKIKKFADDLTAPGNSSVKNVKLALSLHSTDNGFREKIIPTSVRNTLQDIYKEISYFYQKTRNKVTYEYIHFENLNDTENDIKRIARLLRMIPSNLNVIPFHKIDFELEKPLDVFNNKQDTKNLLSNEKLNDFIDKLKNEKVIVNLRSSSGSDINAACGQLSFNQEKISGTEYKPIS